MHLSQVDLNLFVVLEAIYREGNITRAGHQLNLTQPAISHALSRLREMFSDPLFERQGQAMIPTPLARGIIEPVRRSLRNLEITLNEVARFDHGLFSAGGAPGELPNGVCACAKSTARRKSSRSFTPRQ